MGLTNNPLERFGDAYTEMLSEMLNYTLEHGASKTTLYRIFYHMFREVSVASHEDHKGMLRDAARRVKPFRELKKKGQAGRDRPVIRSITLIYPDSQNWRLREGCVELRTHRSWIRIV